MPKLPTRLAQSRRLRRWAIWCSLEAVVRVDVPGERTLEGGGDQDVKVRVSSSLIDHLGIFPKRGLKYKMAGRVEPLVCRIPYWGCRALCCHCLCPLPHLPGLCGHGKDSSSLCLAFEDRYVHCKSPSIFWKLEGNSHHLKSFAHNVTLAFHDMGFPGCFLFRLIRVIVFPVSSGLLKLCLINAGLACPGETSKINASAFITWKCTLLG